MPQTETATRDQYLTEAHAELDVMLGEVGELNPPPPPRTSQSWARLLVIAAIAVAVFVIGMVLLRGRRPGRMTLNLVR